VPLALREARRRRAELLRQIFEVDPLPCPACGAEMRIVAFITQRVVIDRILDHLRRASESARGHRRRGAVRDCTPDARAPDRRSARPSDPRRLNTPLRPVPPRPPPGTAGTAGLRANAVTMPHPARSRLRPRRARPAASQRPVTAPRHARPAHRPCGTGAIRFPIPQKVFSRCGSLKPGLFKSPRPKVPLPLAFGRRLPFDFGY